MIGQKSKAVRFGQMVTKVKDCLYCTISGFTAVYLKFCSAGKTNIEVASLDVDELLL